MTKRQRGELVAMLAFASKAFILGGFCMAVFGDVPTGWAIALAAVGAACLAVGYKLAGGLGE